MCKGVLDDVVAVAAVVGAVAIVGIASLSVTGISAAISDISAISAISAAGGVASASTFGVASRSCCNCSALPSNKRADTVEVACECCGGASNGPHGLDGCATIPRFSTNVAWFFVPRFRG